MTRFDATARLQFVLLLAAAISCSVGAAVATTTGVTIAGVVGGLAFVGLLVVQVEGLLARAESPNEHQQAQVETAKRLLGREGHIAYEAELRLASAVAIVQPLSSHDPTMATVLRSLLGDPAGEEIHAWRARRVRTLDNLRPELNLPKRELPPRGLMELAPAPPSAELSTVRSVATIGEAELLSAINTQADLIADSDSASPVTDWALARRVEPLALFRSAEMVADVWAERIGLNATNMRAIATEQWGNFVSCIAYAICVGLEAERSRRDAVELPR